MAESAFPSPYEIDTPAGCEGWEEMYPYYALFSESRREADENRFWFWNSMHFPVPMPAFDVACIDAPYQAVGAWQNRFFAIPPAMGIDYRIVNGYVYISGNPVTDPAKIAERVEYFQRRAGHYFQHWDELYGRWRDKMEALIAEITTLRVPELPEYEPDEVMEDDARQTAFYEVLDAYGRTLRCGDLMWQHHFEFLLLGYGAYMTFSEFCKAQLPDIPEQHIAQMVAGIDVLLFRPGAELSRLAKLAIDTGVDDAFVEGRTPAEIDTDLRESEAGRAWLEALEQIKDPWFNMAVGDGLYHFYGSWYDDPSIPYAAVIGHVRALKAGEQVDRPSEELARERDRLAGSTARCSTRSAQGTFDELLGLSRTVFPYVEEHKFYCDYWFLTRWWNKLREFGALLADHGFLADKEDMFHLSRHEVAEAIDELLLTWATGGAPAGPSPLAADRRAAQGAAREAGGVDAPAGDRRHARRDHRPDVDHALGRHHAARPGVGEREGRRLAADRRGCVAGHRRGPGARRGQHRRPRRGARRRHPRVPDHLACVGADLPEGHRGGHRHRRRHVARRDRLPRVRAAGGGRHRPGDCRHPNGTVDPRRRLDRDRHAPRRVGPRCR